MNYIQMSEAIDEAKRTKKSFELQTRVLAGMLKGNLRSVSMRDQWGDHEILVALKRELSQYDAKKRQWKN